MLIEPFEVLEAFAREQFRKQKAAAPKPQPVNLQPLIRIGAAREFEWGGVTCRAPPLPFLLAIRLLVVAHSLEELREMQADRGPATRTAVGLIRHAVRCRWRKLAKRLTDPDEIEALLWWLLDVGDKSARTSRPGSSTRKPTFDYMDTLSSFTTAFPAWCHTTTSAWLAGRWHLVGMPRSWTHYQFGVRHLVRARHRKDLRMAQAMRLAQAKAEDYAKFERQWAEQAGW